MQRNPWETEVARGGWQINPPDDDAGAPGAGGLQEWADSAAERAAAEGGIGQAQFE